MKFLFEEAMYATNKVTNIIYFKYQVSFSMPLFLFFFKPSIVIKPAIFIYIIL